MVVTITRTFVLKVELTKDEAKVAVEQYFALLDRGNGIDVSVLNKILDPLHDAAIGK